MQMAVIEAARNLAGLEDAGSEEFDHEAGKARFTPVVYHLKEWVQGNEKVSARSATTRAAPCASAPMTRCSRKARVAQIYGTTHRRAPPPPLRGGHRYREKLEDCGLTFSGMSPDGRLPEIVEWSDHPWFIGVQFHPELKSKPFAPHPLFADFVRAAIETSRLV